MNSSSTSLNPPRGMRDFYPSDMAVRTFVFDAWRRAAERFGFQAYDAPVVESLELLKRKSGEEIVDQIYAFEDKSGRELALRAEMTPTLARMVAARMGSLTLPLKWYTIAQCFRYERMTRGRKREHFQLNLDIIGEPSLGAEVEVIATAVAALQEMGLDHQHIVVKYNSRELLRELLEHAGVMPPHHAATFLALDKRGKIADDEILKLLQEQGLNPSQTEAAMRVMAIDSLDAARKALGGESRALHQIKDFECLLRQYGLERVVAFDIGVIRGLSYYTGMVFEAFDRNSEFRAIFGGGRYDNLLKDVGGKPETGVGLGFGDVVISEILMEAGLAPTEAATAAVLVGYMQPEQAHSAMQTATRLRADGKTVDLALSAEKPKSFFSRAGRGAYTEAVFIGPDDVSKGTIRLKNLATREEQELPLAPTVA